MVTKNKLLGIIFALGVLTGCENVPTFEKSYVFDKSEWAQNVKPSFTVDIQDISKEYNFILTIRTTTEYKFSNLWMYMSTTTPKGDKAREPFELIIANQDGSWAGTKTGTVVETSLQFKKRKMPEKGKYTFVLEQGITQSNIDEILDVTLLVEEAGAEEK
jgi:gliding motility-associated lipoprotein GldH